MLNEMEGTLSLSLFASSNAWFDNIELLITEIHLLLTYFSVYYRYVLCFKLVHCNADGGQSS